MKLCNSKETKDKDKDYAKFSSWNYVFPERHVEVFAQNQQSSVMQYNFFKILIFIVGLQVVAVDITININNANCIT